MKTNERFKEYNVFKGLQRPIQFKGLKGSFIYYAFAIAIGSLLVGLIVSPLTSMVTGFLTIAFCLIGGIIGLALYQRKYGLYRKSVIRGIFIIKNLFDV
jgi:hypothetical protein